MRGWLRLGLGTRVPRLVVALATGLALLPGSASAAEPDPAGDPPSAIEMLVPYEALTEGDAGADVSRMQRLLQDAGFYRGPITGVYDETTASSVVTLHKYLDIDRGEDFNALDWVRLELLPEPDIPHRWNEPDRVEIDTTRQLLYVIRDHDIVGILPTSTGSGRTYFSVRQGRDVRAATPHGDFELYWRQYGWNCDSVTGWCVYNYWGFTAFYGIHGYRNVPSYPASHGCTRVHVWDSDWLDDYLFIGMPVHIWRERPEIEPHPLLMLPDRDL